MAFSENYLVNLQPKDLQTARLIQENLRRQVIREDSFLEEIRIIGGVDVSNNPKDPENLLYAAAIALDLSSLTVIKKSFAIQKAYMPYRSGFLSFRELPVLIEAIRPLQEIVDVWMVDGHGISHPRNLGIASHLGVLLDIPTIGVAKNILVGKAEKPLDILSGSMQPLIYQNQQIGVVLRTKKNNRPLIISIGNRCNLETAINLVQKSLKGYRLPEPTRLAHYFVNQFRLSQK